MAREHRFYSTTHGRLTMFVRATKRKRNSVGVNKERKKVKVTDRFHKQNKQDEEATFPSDNEEDVEALGSKSASSYLNETETCPEEIMRHMKESKQDEEATFPSDNEEDVEALGSKSASSYLNETETCPGEIVPHMKEVRGGGVSHVEEEYMTFSRVLESNLSQQILWDVPGEDPEIRRFATPLSTILESYIKKLQTSHAERKVHNYKDVPANIGFINNNYNEIHLIVSPSKPEKGTFTKMKIQDYRDVAMLIQEINMKHGFGKLPDEIKHFVDLLEDPIGNELLIGRHFCLLGPLQRIKLVGDIQRKRESKAFRNVVDRKLFEDNSSFKTYLGNTNFFDKFENDHLLNKILHGESSNQEGKGNKGSSVGKNRFKCTRRGVEKGNKGKRNKDKGTGQGEQIKNMQNVGREQGEKSGLNVARQKPKRKGKRGGEVKRVDKEGLYSNTLANLIRFIRNGTSHTVVDDQGNVISRLDIERRIFYMFPFYLHLLCTKMICVGLFPRIDGR